MKQNLKGRSKKTNVLQSIEAICMEDYQSYAKSNRAITLISLVITIIILMVLASVAINMTLGDNGLISKTKEAKKEYAVSQIREQVELGITNIELERITLSQTLTIEDALQELLEDGIFESIDKEEKIGYIGEYEVKLKYDENNKVVIEYVEKSTGVIITYTLDPVGYTNQNNVGILFNVKGKVKSVTKPDGLEIYPKKETIAIDYPVTANGTYTFVVENEDGTIQKKNVIVDTIDTLEPKNFTITAEDIGGGCKITANAEDADATDTSACSGIEKYEYYIKLSTDTVYIKYDTNEINDLASGTYSVYAIAYDRAGNYKQSNTTTVEITKKRISVTVEEIINNPKEYYGKEVANYTAGGYIYRIFYVDTENYFGDGKNTVYLKADYASTTVSLSTSYDSENTKVKTMNPLWAVERETASWNDNEKAAAYLCSPVKSSNSSLPWAGYFDSSKANYVIGGASVEMFVKSYNQVEAYKYASAEAERYVLGATYRETKSPGYIFTINNKQSTISKNDYCTGEDSLDVTSTYDNMYCGRKGKKGMYEGSYGYWLASPSSVDFKRVCYVQCDYPRLYGAPNDTSTLCSLSPLVSLKSGVKIQIYDD